jgi:4-amino-4-deoxy-L-arabinose transferase-like glycosyltransferase
VQRLLPSLILICAIACGTLFFGLGSLPLTGADEPRYARIAQEMHDRSAWVTPTLQDRPWLEKPPLYYWITSPLYSLFKNPETAARVGPALCALITTLAVFWVGSALWSNLAGLVSALILLTSLGLAGFGRSAATDMPFTCCLTLALVILAIALEKDIGKKSLAAYVFLGLATLGKGPVALILAVGIGLIFWFLDTRGGALRRWHWIGGLFIAMAVAFPWFWLAFQQNGFAFIATFFINHNLARYTTDIHHHSQPFYYYLPVLIALFFPWSGWLLVIKFPIEGLPNLRHRDSGRLFLFCWFLFPIIFFSLSGSKLAGYILPSLPPLALLLGVPIAQGIQEKLRLPRLHTALLLHLILSTALAVAAPIIFWKNYGGNEKIGLLIATAIIVPAVLAYVYGLKGKILQAFGATAFQGFLTVVIVVLFAFPVLGDYHSTRTLAHQALSLKQPDESIVAYRFFHHSLHYYTNYQVVNQLDDIDALLQFSQTNRSFLAVTKASGMKELESCKKIKVQRLAKQGSFFLLHLSHNN